MSQSQPPVEPPSEEAENHPPQPRTNDAVLGGTAPSPVGCVVLGGLEGVKRRLAAAAIEQRLAALQDALRYGEAGLELVMLGLKDESRQVQYAAFSLLAAQDSSRIKKRLKNYLPWFEFEVVTVDAQGRESNRYRKQAQYFPEDLGNGVFLEMVSIPGGTFLMGSPSTEAGPFGCPQQVTVVQPFYLGKFPVTQKQWQAVAALPQVRIPLITDPSGFKGDNLPIEQISWYEAVEFCERLSKKTGRTYKLPSDAEWEYACRAGTTTPFHFGNTITTDLANYPGKYPYASGPQGIERDKTTPVGSFQVANAFGLYDMHGNVLEWCADPWNEHYPVLPSVPSDSRVSLNNSHTRDCRSLRGGSWDSYPWYCRSVFRLVLFAGTKYDFIGFRVGCTAARTL